VRNPEGEQNSVAVGEEGSPDFKHGAEREREELQGTNKLITKKGWRPIGPATAEGGQDASMSSKTIKTRRRVSRRRIKGEGVARKGGGRVEEKEDEGENTTERTR